ncbi:hypothetical protein TanjilG_30883 [Lupinus angustifolius]|uniref:DYW domain-containing protein n=1 Tax=Lupinus angustifolius TaxID=3871 RepID=A0A394D9S0_LUPAN|nr:PREDICTED: pentatricopeptide repeat-containing protein At5g03800 [Lupinus angustifolius]OIW19949.1 hypothetical protein TanjilG_30883 [Lupinus angustifolius]
MSPLLLPIHPLSFTSFPHNLKPPLPFPSKFHTHSLHISHTSTSTHFSHSNELPLFDSLFSLLRFSTHHSDANLTRTVHAAVIKHDQDTHLSTALITAYLNHKLFSEAYSVFLSLTYPNVVTYSALISAFSKSNLQYKALELFFQMRSSGVHPNRYTFVAVLTACIRLLDFHVGLQMHAMVVKTGDLECPYVTNALMSLYGKCGFHDVVLQLFDEMPHRDIVSWNTVINSAVSEFMYGNAFELFREMQATDAFRVDDFTLSTLLTACSGCGAVMEGQQVYAHAIKAGLDTDLSVGNALIGFYTKCGIIDDVVWLFERMKVRDVITWTEMVGAYMEFGLVDLAFKIFNDMPEKNAVSYNALLSGFCQNGEGLKTLDLFINMVEEGLELTDFSLTSVVNACSLVADYNVSKQVHGFVLKFGCGSNACIEAALLDMYTRCEKMADAKNMFVRWELEELRDVAWTSMICGYARNGELDEAISLVHRSQSEGKMIMDEVASVSMLSLCGTIGCHDIGKQIHCNALKFGFESNMGVGNAVVSMYFKCGNVDDAIKMFEDMPLNDVVSWNTLISGHLLHRQGDRALDIWSLMQKKGIKPDQVTFIFIISAYRLTNLNLVDDCRNLFNSMRTLYQIEPTSEHYSSFVSVLGYWGLLEEAEETIKKMPFEPSTPVWRALLDSCRLHKNTTIEKRVARNILALEPKDPYTYILVSNLYSAYGRWHCSEVVRENMKEKGFRKHPAQSWIICEKKIHSFYLRDKSHPQEKDIYSGLDILIMECLKAGYEPDTSFVLLEVEEFQKKHFLFYHSAKLAAAYGILMTKPGKPIRIVKNILLCGDCHTFFKYLSVVAKRDIFLRDSSGFHCFSNGQCSCNDYR